MVFFSFSHFLTIDLIYRWQTHYVCLCIVWYSYRLIFSTDCIYHAWHSANIMLRWNWPKKHFCFAQDGFSIFLDPQQKTANESQRTALINWSCDEKWKYLRRRHVLRKFNASKSRRRERERERLKAETIFYRSVSLNFSPCPFSHFDLFVWIDLFWFRLPFYHFLSFLSLHSNACECGLFFVISFVYCKFSFDKTISFVNEKRNESKQCIWTSASLHMHHFIIIYVFCSCVRRRRRVLVYFI